MTWHDDVRARAAKAADGPWCLQCFYGLFVIVNAEGEEVAQVNGDYPPHTAMQDSAEFITNAITDLPRCLAWMEGAKAVLNDAWTTAVLVGQGGLQERIQALLAELEEA